MTPSLARFIRSFIRHDSATLFKTIRYTSRLPHSEITRLPLTNTKSNQIIKVPSHHSNITRLAEKHDLVLLDLDDVILASTQYLGGGIWGHNHYANHHINNITIEESISDFYYCANRTKHRTVSEQLIREFSFMSRYKTVLGFTARTINFAPETIAHVDSVGMRFSSITMEKKYPLLNNGIIFMRPEPGLTKGDIILDFLSHFYSHSRSTIIKSIFFMDDLIKNLEDVSISIKMKTKIEFLGIHYTEERERYRNFTSEELKEIAKYQLQILRVRGIIPSDEEALKFLTQNNVNENHCQTRTASTDERNHDDKEIVDEMNYPSHNGGNKTAIPITTAHQILSLEENEYIHEYDETNITHILELLQRHEEETYGDLKFNFDNNIKEFDLKTYTTSTPEELDDSADIFYAPEWLSGLLAGEPAILDVDLNHYALAGIVLLGMSQALHHQQHAHENLMQF